MPQLQMEDVTTRLLRTSPTGVFAQHRLWEVRLGPDPDEPRALMVAKHEMLHDMLNAATAYGALLTAVGVLARDKLASAARVGSFVEHARETHEVYATSVAAWQTPGDADELLAPYPAYHGYLAQGQRIAPGWQQGSMAKTLAAEAVAMVCMQSPALEWSLTSRLDTLDPSLLPEPYAPDRRWQTLERRLDTAAWERIARQVVDCVTEVDELNPLMSPDAPQSALFTDGAIRASQELREALRACLIAELTAEGHETMSDQGFSDAVSRLHEEVKRLAPWRGAGILLNPQYDLTNFVDGERLVVRDDRLIARVHQWGDHVEPVTPVGSVTLDHFLVVARPVARVLDQYDLDEVAQARLVEASYDGICVIVRTSGMRNGQMEVDIWPVLAPDGLRALADNGAGLGMVSSICASALTRTRWSEQWLDALVAHTSPTALVDIPPRRLFDGLPRHAPPSWESGTAIRHDKSRVAIWVWHPGKPLDVPFVTIASPFALVAVEAAASATWPESEHEQDPNQPIDRVLAIVLSHVVNEEPYFDFEGGVDARTAVGE